jgi:predicted transcriptional regulator
MRSVNAKAKIAVESAEDRQPLLDIAAQADAAEGIRQGLEDADSGRVRKIREFFAEFEATHGIRR